jgi:hypothetical protein
VFVSSYDEIARCSTQPAALQVDPGLLRQFELEAGFVDLRHALLNRPERAAVVLRSLVALTR